MASGIKVYTASTAAVLGLLEERWKLIILFHLFGGKVRRYSDVKKLIPSISLAQRKLEADGIASRTPCPPLDLPPK